MKRLCIVLLSALLAVLCLSSAFAGSMDQLPPEIRDYFSSSAFDGMSVLGTANGQEIGGSDACYFVLIRKANRENALYQFKLNNRGSWEHAYSTNKAVPQTDHTIEILLSYTGNEWPTDEYFNTPRLSILQHDAGNEYPELCLTFELSEGKWLLHRVWSYTDYDSMLIKEGSVSYYRDIESAEIAGTSSRPSSNGWPCRRCTAQNKGTPMSGSTTMCASLPRRGPTMSAASAAMTPTVATAAASAPKAACMKPDTRNSPSAHEAPFST